MEEQTVEVDEARASQIKEYLMLLDLITDIGLVYLPRKGEIGQKTVFSQPGMRYAMAEALIKSLLTDARFGEMDIADRSRVLERVLGTARGLIMEEIVLLETRNSCPDATVCKVQFATGEFDMVVHDEKNLTCRIYEIKHSAEAVPEHYRHLVDAENCALAERFFGKIAGKYVIYRGSPVTDGEIRYLNVEEYLRNLRNL